MILLKYYEIGKDCKILDIGTGGGFPGIPLKIFYSDNSFILMDSINKKLEFIKEVIEELSLSDITVVHARAEDLGHDPSYREKFDIVVSRAVANLSSLAELSLPFVKENGLFISYKGSSAKDEIENAKTALEKLGGELFQINDYQLPFGEDKRSLIFIKKRFHCPNIYPRKAGVPLRKPL